MNKPSNHPIDDLIAVMAKLRDPDGGCPWDLQQNFKSIAPYTIEEAYEVLDAIERGDMDDLREELGDLLLQPIYHAQMADENGTFDIYDVIRDITAKMVSRHPHVFGDAVAGNAADVNAIWEAKKSAENAQKNKGDSALDGVTKALPALLRAQKLQKHAAKTGFEFETPDGALEKLNEELEELREAVEHDDTPHMHEEFGDALFALVNYGRMLGIDGETALRDCNGKFEQRFKTMETAVKNDGKQISDLTLTDLLTVWAEAKEVA